MIFFSVSFWATELKIVPTRKSEIRLSIDILQSVTMSLHHSRSFMWFLGSSHFPSKIHFYWLILLFDNFMHAHNIF